MVDVTCSENGVTRAEPLLPLHVADARSVLIGGRPCWTGQMAPAVSGSAAHVVGHAARAVDRRDRTARS